MSAEVAVQERALPARTYNGGGASDLTSDDVALPRIYIGQFTSQAVKDQLVKPGCIYLANGADDPDPNVLAEATGKTGVAADKAVTFHVLALRKGWSHSEQGGDLETWQWDDPNRHPDAWTTYQYTVAIPEIDDQVPARLLLTKSGKNAARGINTVLMKHMASGPDHEVAFEFYTDHRQNDKGEWFVPRIKPVEAKKANQAIAAELALMIGGNAAEARSTGEEPAI